MKDNICIFGELLNQILVADIAFDERDLFEDVGDVLFGASR